MALADRFGLPLTTASAAAANSYIRGVDLLLSANPGAVEALDAAIAADPEFALAHVARARLLQQQGRGPEARQAAAPARALRDRVTARERGHIEALALAIDGAARDALDALELHMRDYPRDALVLSLALGVYGLLGFGGKRDFPEAQLALLESLAPHWDEDWWFLTYLGWSRIETGAIADGSRLVERGLAGNPRNAYAAHARAHGYYEAGDPTGAIAFIDNWLPTYDRAGPLHGHLSWHLALSELARGNRDRAHALYRENIRPGASQAPPMPSLADAASFLWRWRAYGHAGEADLEWDEVAAHAKRYFPRAGFAFADLHAAFAAAATGNEDGVRERIEQLHALERDGRLPPGEIVPVLCTAAAAFANGDYRNAARLLEPLLDELPRIGGSGAQREIFEDTYLAACLRSDQPGKAEARLARRTVLRRAAWQGSQRHDPGMR